jgi:hypothetical protein
VRLRLQGLKLAGDKGRSVPKLHFDSIDVLLVLRASLLVTFNMESLLWEAQPASFRIQVVRFKGPYGLSRPLISPILSLLAPFIRRHVLAALPEELGHFARTLPTAFTLKGRLTLFTPILAPMLSPHTLLSSMLMCPQVTLSFAASS